MMSIATMSWIRRKKSVEPVIDNRIFDLLSITITAVLALHAPHLPWWLSIGLVVILGWRWWQRHQRSGRLPAWLKIPLLALLTLAVIVSYGTIFGREPGTALAVGLLILNCWRRKLRAMCALALALHASR